MRLRTLLVPLGVALLLGRGSSIPEPAEGAEGEKTDSPPLAGEHGDAAFDVCSNVEKER